jgi:hypothetical protein
LAGCAAAGGARNRRRRKRAAACAIAPAVLYDLSDALRRWCFFTVCPHDAPACLAQLAAKLGYHAPIPWRAGSLEAPRTSCRQCCIILAGWHLWTECRDGCSRAGAAAAVLVLHLSGCRSVLPPCLHACRWLCFGVAAAAAGGAATVGAAAADGWLWGCRWLTGTTSRLWACRSTGISSPSPLACGITAYQGVPPHRTQALVLPSRRTTQQRPSWYAAFASATYRSSPLFTERGCTPHLPIVCHCTDCPASLPPQAGPSGKPPDPSLHAVYTAWLLLLGCTPTHHPPTSQAPHTSSLKHYSRTATQFRETIMLR